MPDWNNRNILSCDGTNGIEFSADNLSSTQRSQLEADGLGETADEIVNFLRGDTSNDVDHAGGVFRVRYGSIGDIVHSAPMYYQGTVYIGSNDGMLHAVDSATGEEKFCYVPNLVYDHLGELVQPNYSHRYYVDGTADAAEVNDQDILVCGLGKGGKGYFCLDITNPDAMTPDNVKWEYPQSTDDDMG